MPKTTLKRIDGFKLPMGLLSAAVSPDGKHLIAGCMDGVYTADLDGKNVSRLYQHESYVSSVEFLNESTIVSAGYDGAVRWFDLVEKQETRKLKLHDFWSWDMAVSTTKNTIASVTGQYLAGGYKYEPKPEVEPSLKVVNSDSGEIVHALPHVPSVQAVAISGDDKFVAAGNLMGEVRVFDLSTGEMASKFTTPDFTSWGIIKSHCYLGGIFAIEFTPNNELLLAGMGKMRDPMAGNGKQLWQKWSWQETEPKMLDQTHDGESGEGLMESLAIHPSGELFLMGGRLRGGDWNVALFDLNDGKRIEKLKLGYRVTDAEFFDGGQKLLIAGTQGQPNKSTDGIFKDFGRVEVFDVGT